MPKQPFPLAEIAQTFVESFCVDIVTGRSAMQRKEDITGHGHPTYASVQGLR